MIANRQHHSILLNNKVICYDTGKPVGIPGRKAVEPNLPVRGTAAKDGFFRKYRTLIVKAGQMPPSPNIKIRNKIIEIEYKLQQEINWIFYS